MRVRSSLLAALGLALGAAVYAPDASACGGCFPPPGETNSIVTDHRMILSVSKDKSTLYDQIEYQGSPKSFAWVLPISGTVEVGLSADSLFTAMSSLTAVTVLEPPRNCPPPPSCSYGGSSSSSGSYGASASDSPKSADAGSAPPVTVIKAEVVGPYETVQLKSDDANALTTWLTDHNFAIPADIKDVIAGYVNEHFNFLALKLVPGEGVQAMRPVRVTTPGANAVLPLRMVAAGTGATVGITLWVVGEGRYQPQNFQSFSITDDDLVWDWAASGSNFKDLRAQRSAADPGKTWEIESSVTALRQVVTNAVYNNGYVFGPGGAPPALGGDYLPIEDANHNVTKSADLVRDEDLDTVFAGISEGQARITRMRADLNRAALAVDLDVKAADDQSQLSVTRNPKGELGQPLCPIYDDSCAQVGTLPRDQARQQAGMTRLVVNGGSSESTFACATTPRSDSSSGLALGGLGFLALVVARTARDRRRSRG